MSRTAFLIPVFNEAENVLKLGTLFEQLNISYLFVDDGSTDKTATNLWLKGFTSLMYYPSKGKAFAIREGISYLKKEGYEEIFVVDGTSGRFVTEVLKIYQRKSD